ncbi:MAG: carbamoyltransferase [Candidatus Coatesbacteria bacterium]|nr:carbamoyltransferase [Candidatus Coatesbacteria bacterium]
MYILGISGYVLHSSAALIKDGVLLANVQEERYTRKKHDASFPVNSIQYCLDYAGITIDDIDYIGFHMKPWLHFNKRLWQIVKNLPKSLAFWGTHQSAWSGMRNCENDLKRAFRIRKPHYKFSFIEHHMAHAASCFYVSPFSSAAILTLDGCGEMATTLLASAKDRKITKLDEIFYPHSLGYLWGSFTHYLGFIPDNDEYKVMGLSAYGKPEYYDELSKIVHLKPDASFEIDMSYFNYQKGIKNPWVSEKFIEKFGPIRKKDEEVTDKHANLAKSLQVLTEDIAIAMARKLKDKTGERYLCLSGGTAQNSVMNGRLLHEGLYDDVYVQPASYDGGISIGVAYYLYHQILNQPKMGFIQRHAYLGDEFSKEDILKAIETSNLLYEEYADETITKKVAKLLDKGKIVAWFQGRMETGPRALGNRSILADARREEMKDVVNKKVKKRESFRPFAPSVLHEFGSEYFENYTYNPFMTMVFPVKEDKKKEIPAVTHVDGTARLQSVDRETNPRYWDLINHFRQITGCPVILNTSFNVMGEPIIRTPSEAINCFCNVDIDYLVLGNFLLFKKQDE